MTSRAVKRLLAQDVSLWQADGWITPAQAQVLRQRFDVQGFGLGLVVKYLGVLGALFAGFGLLGLVAAMSRSLGVAAGELLAVAVALLAWGLQLARDPLGRYGQSSRAILAVGLIALTTGGTAGVAAAGIKQGAMILVVGAITLATAFLLAYGFRNGFLLVLAVLGLFHWLGSWESMVGRGAYAISIQDPRAMSLAAAGAVLAGILMRRELLPAPRGFDTVWLSVGLLYLNLSLLILTVEGPGPFLAWILVAVAAAVVQVVLGAVEKSAVLVGFGVTALGLQLFTRYFESCWDRTDQGLFFLLGGAMLLAFGVACEALARRLPGVRP